VQLLARHLTLPWRWTIISSTGKNPLDEDGKPDFEAITALDRERMDSDLNALIDGEKAARTTIF
jgi:hypothetical protein